MFFFFLTASYISDFLELFDDRNFTSDRVKFNFYRDYARSKQCVSMAMQSGCAIGDLMEDDLYNPFCVDGIDPLTLPSASGELICYGRKLQNQISFHKGPAFRIARFYY